MYVYTVSITNDQHTQTHSLKYTHTHAHTHTRAHTRAHTHTHTHTHIHTQLTYSVKCKKCFLAELAVLVVKFLGGSNSFGSRPVVDCV